MRNKLFVLFAVTACLVAFQNCSGGFKSTGAFSESNSASNLASIGSTPSNPATSALPDSIKNQNYVLTFEDTFQTLDTISPGPTGSGFKWWNGTKQCCMDDSWGAKLPTVMFPTDYNGQRVNPYSLIPNGGGLNIALSRQNGFWSSGILSSVDGAGAGFKQQYGYFEIKAKQPKGLGVWPAFWMVNNDPNLPGEIDIFEYYGVSGGTSYAISLHDWRNGGNNQNIPEPQAFPKTVDQTAGFHTYGFLWTEANLVFYFDGQEVWRHATPDVMKTPYFIYVNNGMGGGWPTDQTPGLNYFQVQYVRAYQAPPAP